MPDDIRISDLSPVSAITNGALLELSNEDSGAETGYVSVKMTITQLATKLNVSMQYLTDLLTNNKTIAGAINELNEKLTIGTSAPTSLMGNDGDFYLQYTEETGGADDEVDAFFVKLDGVWCQISTGGGGSGGHTILDDSGTALTQRANLQFKGAYSEDNSGDDTTEVNVVRSMTKAQYEQLSSDEKVGIINVTDEDITATDIPISANDPTDTKSYIDNVVSSGSNANGYYIKYADGTMICTKSTEFSVATSEWQAWGSCYETALKDCGVWAMNFISSPVVSATQTGGAAWLEYFYDTDNTNVGKTRFVRPTVPGATAIYKMNVIGIGRWKA